MIRAAGFSILVIVTNLSFLILFPLTLERFLLFTLAYSIGTLFTIYLLFSPRSSLLIPNRSKVPCKREPCITLTFDDGPFAETTSRLLDILQDKDVRAVFFIVGERAVSQHNLILRMQEEGHIIANHTFTHPNLFCFLRPRQLKNEIRDCQRIIKSFTGKSSKFFRSPVGLRHPLLHYYLKCEDLEYLSWRVRAFDTFDQESGMIKKNLIRKLRSGDVILLHDGYERTLAMLPDFIDEMKARGYKFLLP